MSPHWWHSPDDSDFAKYLLDIAPPADRKYVSQIKCPAVHQERICMGVATPSDFARRYLTVRNFSLTYSKIIFNSVTVSIARHQVQL